MCFMPSQWQKREAGQSVVVFALALVAILALAGLAVDGSFAFEHLRRASTAADAVALAGTRGLLLARQANQNGTAVHSAIANAIAAQNLTGITNLTWTANYTRRDGTVISPVVAGAAIPSEARGIQVTIAYRFATFFIPVLGFESLPADARATAAYGPIGAPPGGDLIPLAVSRQAAEAMQNQGGNVIIFGPQSGSFKDLPGAFGSVDLVPNGNPANGNSNDCYSSTPRDSQTYFWCQGTRHQVNIGDRLPVNTGALGNALTDEVEYRARTRPVGLVPVFDQAQGTGNNISYRVIGFVTVELLDPNAQVDADGDGRVDDPPYNLNGSNSQECRNGFPPPPPNGQNGTPKCSYISARFVSMRLFTGGISSTAFDGGAYTINLIR
ncbi:MAG: pilus assembly protein TadG-related protein [Chloroflexus sp.]|nr:pilus assembly protein TadG-related protein [Chloroflexus sp.]